MKTKILLTVFLSVIFLGRISFAQDFTVYEAEESSFYKAAVEIEHAGFSGSGYVNFDNEPGGYIELIFTMQEEARQNIIVYYANGSGSNRLMEFDINGTLDTADFNSTTEWTNWQTQTIKLDLLSGRNSLRMTSISSDGGPNIDKIEIYGQPGAKLYSLQIIVIGQGNVSITPADSIFEEGTNITLEAVSESPWYFSGWQGDLTSSYNPFSFVIDANTNLIAEFKDATDSMIIHEDTPVGFASVSADNQDGTTGGYGGEVINVYSGSELKEILDSRRDPSFSNNYDPLIVIVNDTLRYTEDEMMNVEETYDLTIFGKGNNAVIEGFGLNITESHNIIVRNIEFRDCPDDAINVQGSLTHHVCIDHCTFSDSPDVDYDAVRHDGLVDIKRGANYVTVSWNHFYNHHKTCLLGHNDANGDQDIGRLKVTYHHNWFEGTRERMPRVRFGEVHVFNNFYDNRSGRMNYAIASTMDAKVVVEGNYFLNVDEPTHSGYGNSGPGEIIEFNNYYENCGTPEVYGSAFNPSDYYSFSVTDPLLVKDSLVNYTGNGKIDSVITNVENDNTIISGGFILYQNYPNPFNPTTTIRYYVPFRSEVNLYIYDINGRLVENQDKFIKDKGIHLFKFTGENLSSGVYFCTIITKTFQNTIKMLLIK
ncbi:MAG: T9SS type A sorting domain-containing protein [Ignavibacteria bacterium]|jgi:pectate lyase